MSEALRWISRCRRRSFIPTENQAIHILRNNELRPGLVDPSWRFGAAPQGHSVPKLILNLETESIVVDDIFDNIRSALKMDRTCREAAGAGPPAGMIMNVQSPGRTSSTQSTSQLRYMFVASI